MNIAPPLVFSCSACIAAISKDHVYTKYSLAVSAFCVALYVHVAVTVFLQSLYTTVGDGRSRE